MNEARRRLLEGSQALYLGLVGMVLAISLELLVARVSALAGTGLARREVVLLGLQVLALLQALLYLWVAWGLGTALLRVVPGYLDAAAPLAVGLFAFVAVSWIDPREPLALLWLNAAAFGSIILPTARLFARAEREAANTGVLEGMRARHVLAWNAAIAAAGFLAALAGSLSGRGQGAAVAGYAAVNLLIAGATAEWLRQVRRAAGAVRTSP